MREREFMVSLPAHLEGAGFNLYAPEGGYGPLIDEVTEGITDSFDITGVYLAQNQSHWVLLRVIIDPDDAHIVDGELRMASATAQLLDGDAHDTGQYVVLDLTIYLDTVRTDRVAGIVRIFQDVSPLTEAG